MNALTKSRPVKIITKYALRTAVGLFGSLPEETETPNSSKKAKTTFEKTHRCWKYASRLQRAGVICNVSRCPRYNAAMAAGKPSRKATPRVPHRRPNEAVTEQMTERNDDGTKR